MLFTGDSLWLDGDEWIAAVLEDSDRDGLHREPRAAEDGRVRLPRAVGSERGRAVVRAQADPAKLDAVIERLRRGEDR